jgi:hypothetical protein
MRNPRVVGPTIAGDDNSKWLTVRGRKQARRQTNNDDQEVLR